MRTLLLTPYQCLVKNNNDEILLSPNETLLVDGRLLVYPLEKFTPPPFSLDTSDLQRRKEYAFLKTDDETIVCLKSGTMVENFSIAKTTVAGQPCTFEIGEDKIVLTNRDTKKIIHLNSTFDKFTLSSRHNIVCLQLTSEDGNALVTINIKTNKTKVFYGKSIALANNTFSIQEETPLFHINKSYKIDDEGLKQSSSSTNVFNYNELTLPYCFLKALQEEEFDLAYDICSQELKDKIDKKALKNFFGHVENFYCLSPIKYAVCCDGALKLCFLQVDNGKIIDIDLV